MAAWLLGEIPQPARSSLCGEVTPDTIYPSRVFQSKQQLVVFSSLRTTLLTHSEKHVTPRTGTLLIITHIVSLTQFLMKH